MEVGQLTDRGRKAGREAEGVPGPAGFHLPGLGGSAKPLVAHRPAAPALFRSVSTWGRWVSLCPRSPVGKDASPLTETRAWPPRRCPCGLSWLYQHCSSPPAG